MKATTRLRAIAVLSSSVFTLAAFGQAGGEPPADPSEPAAVTPRYIENPFDIDVVEVAKGHATVVECLSFVDIGTGTTSEIAQRRARHVFGTGPRRRSTLHFVLFDTPQKDEKGPTSNYTRPALESGYVYSRLYSAETDDGSEAATRNRIDRIQAELRSLKEKLANISDDGNVNIAGQQAQLEEQIADLNREQQVESDWLEQIQTTRIFLTAGSEEPDDPQPQDPDEPRDEDDGEDD